MTSKMERAAILKESAELEGDLSRKAELLADHYKLMAEESEGNASRRYLQEMYNCVSKFEETATPSNNPEVLRYVMFEDCVATVHAAEVGVAEITSPVYVEAAESKLSKIGVALNESEDYGQTYRVIVTDLVEDIRSDFNFYQNSKDGTFSIRMLNEDSTLVEKFVEYMSTPIVEDLEKYDAWKKDVESKYPEHRGRIKYVGKSDNGKNHISAEVHGIDRSFGVFDLEKNEGQVLSEDAEEIDVQNNIDGRVYKLKDRPDKMWYDSSRLWNHHVQKINRNEYSGKLDRVAEGSTWKLIDPKSNRTVALYNSDVKHGWIISDHENSIKKDLTESIRFHGGSPDVDHMPGAVYRYSSAPVEINNARPDKVWYNSKEDWDSHMGRINSAVYDDNLSWISQGQTHKTVDEDTNRTIGLFNLGANRGWIIADHSGHIKEAMEEQGYTLVESRYVDSADYRETSGGHKAREERVREKDEDDSEDDSEDNNVESGKVVEAKTTDDLTTDEEEKLARKERLKNALSAVDELSRDIIKSRGLPTGRNYDARQKALIKEPPISEALLKIEEGAESEFIRILGAILNQKLDTRYQEIKNKVAGTM